VRFATAEDEARAVLVEARILRGGCDGTTIYTVDLVVSGTTMARAPEELAKGPYGFAARARDENCIWFAETCIEDDLPQDVETPLIVLLGAGDEMAACSVARCTEGRCDGEVRDGGTPADGGGMRDGGMDAGRDGGVETPDGTIPDGNVVDAPPNLDGCVPETEVCDGRDNNCNSIVDDGFRICGDEDASCVMGACTCGAGSTYSMGRCYATDVDPMNCGTVGHTCAATEYCTLGSCECRVGLVRATSGARMGECVDRTSDPLACGSGYASCAAMGSMRSCRNTCEDSCNTGQTRCDVSSASCTSCGSCIPDALLASHPLHCGGCGIACAADEVCVEGGCRSYRATSSCGECEGTRPTCCTYDGSRLCLGGISACPAAGTFWLP
jgi:hypothetical protein